MNNNQIALYALVSAWTVELENNSPKALDYVTKSMNFSNDVISNGEIGYAPDGWNFILNNPDLAKYKEQYVEMGLLKKSEKGSIYDFFRNRIVFTIFKDSENSQEITGFSARALDYKKDGSNGPKYLHLKVSDEALYGHFPSRKRSLSVISEGIKDALKLRELGFKYSVAALGSSITSHSSKEVTRLSDQIYLMFDSDDAGTKAILKAAINLYKNSVDCNKTKIFVITFPDKDPSDLCDRVGTMEGLKNDTAVSKDELWFWYASTYMIDKFKDLNNSVEKSSVMIQSFKAFQKDCGYPLELSKGLQLVENIASTFSSDKKSQ